MKPQLYLQSLELWGSTTVRFDNAKIPGRFEQLILARLHHLTNNHRV